MRRGLCLLSAHLGEFACVQPITGAIGALVDLNSAFGAEEMAMQLHSLATGTLALAGAVHHQARVVLDMKQRLASHLGFFIDPL